jgi:hypothetical protein
MVFKMALSVSGGVGIAAIFAIFTVWAGKSDFRINSPHCCLILTEILTLILNPTLILMLTLI